MKDTTEKSERVWIPPPKHPCPWCDAELGNWLRRGIGECFRCHRFFRVKFGSGEEATKLTRADLEELPDYHPLRCALLGRASPDET